MEIKEKHTEKAYKEKEQLSCPLLKQGCGGCPMLALPYEEQLRKKQKKIKKLLGNFGKTTAHYWNGKSLALSE